MKALDAVKLKLGVRLAVTLPARAVMLAARGLGCTCCSAITVTFPLDVGHVDLVGHRVDRHGDRAGALGSVTVVVAFVAPSITVTFPLAK